MELAMDSKDGDVNVSPEEEKMVENLWVACRYAGMSVCRIVTRHWLFFLFLRQQNNKMGSV
jgi:hypothetical protein